MLNLKAGIAYCANNNNKFNLYSAIPKKFKSALQE
jgi:hypothetical protein